MTAKLTLLISCKNESQNIRAAIESALGLADEILVADNGSTDTTLDIVAEYPICRTIYREYIDYGNFQNWAIPQASHPWVFILDADERITEELAVEIRTILQKDGQNKVVNDGYWVYRKNHFMGHPVRFGGWQSDKVMRLFRRDQGRYQGTTDHAQASIATGNIGFLKKRLIHHTYRSYNDYFHKFQRYTSYQAKRWHEGGKKASFAKLFFAAPLRFIHSYLFRLGFLDGKVGLQISMTTAFYSFMKQARLWELESTPKQAEAENIREKTEDTLPAGDLPNKAA
ncbi:MAG: glycosyltransferase family 2 protein [Pirellulaceae bacterium]|nr:glycosyltransferase family 2 protein [Pirellulaceae bacterium]